MGRHLRRLTEQRNRRQYIEEGVAAGSLKPIPYQGHRREAGRPSMVET